jgi:hypothetical protein
MKWKLKEGSMKQSKGKGHTIAPSKSLLTCTFHGAALTDLFYHSPRLVPSTDFGLITISGTF